MAENTSDSDKKILEFEAGQEIMHEGELAKGLYVLMAGELDVTYSGVKVAEIVTKGSFVGEIASLLGGRRIASVVARTPAKMLCFDNVTRYFQTNPESALLIAKSLASRISEMNKRIVRFEEVGSSWLKASVDAIQKDDVGPIRDALREIRKTFVSQMAGE